MAIGIDADSITKLSSQQPINRHIQPLAEQIPKRGFYAADRIVDNARNRTGP